MGVVHTWIKRGECPGCGLVWTTPHSPNVVCACRGGGFADGVPFNLDPVTDDAAFKTGVAADIGVAENELTLVEGSE